MISTPTTPVDVPELGSAEELSRFAALQARLEPLARRGTPDSPASQTVGVLPSFTLDIEGVGTDAGVSH